MMDKIELTKLLGQNNISTEEWEKGEAKSLEHLLAEINSGEVVLNFSPETGLVRELKAVGVNVRYINELNQTYLLKEEKQIFKDGRERRRKLDASLAEKVKP